MKWMAVLVITLGVFFGLVKLAHWQWSRAEQKEARLARLAERAKNPLSLGELLRREDVPVDYRAWIEGRFDNRHALLLDNRTWEGQVGYQLLLPLHTDHGWLLVNLGWLPAPLYRQQLPGFAPISEAQRITGRLAGFDSGVTLADTPPEPGWPKRIQALEHEELERALRRPLLPFVLLLDESVPLGYPRHWQPVVIPPERHRAYALQWLGLALVWLIGVILVWQRRPG